MNYLKITALVLFSCIILSCGNSNNQTEAAATEIPATSTQSSSATPVDAAAVDNQGMVVKLTTQQFIDQIFDYKNNPDAWKYKGGKPAIIDFYADWCRPCKMVAPIMEELAAEYKGQINIYKVNTDEEKELAGQVFGIQSIPSILFIPMNGQPQMQAGAMSKEEYVKLIQSVLIKK